MEKKAEETPEEQVAEILRDNITFAPQLHDYVIHGAIEKLIEWRELYAAQRVDEVVKELHNAVNMLNTIDPSYDTSRYIALLNKHTPKPPVK